MTRTKMIAVVLGLAVAGGTGATLGLAAGNGAGTTIAACVNKAGEPRFVAAGTTCRRDETTVSWNVQGPQGPAGPQGPQGPQGQPGLATPIHNTVGTVSVTDQNGQPIVGGTGTSGAFEIKDWSFGVENPTTIGSATGGAGAGKIKFNEFQITKMVDGASPAFFKNCVAGTHLKTVNVAYRPASAASDVLDVTLNDAVCDSITQTTQDDGTEVEVIAFSFRTIAMTDPQSGVTDTETWPATG